MANKILRLLIFDLDGTLVESREDIATATNQMRQHYSLPPLPQPSVDKLIGSGIRELVRRALNDPGAEKLDQAQAQFQVFYNDHCLDQTRLYPEVSEVLRYFRQQGKKMAVATNKKTDLSKKILAGLGVGGMFDLVIGGDGQYKRKPDPEGLSAIMAHLGCSAEETAMIGDSSLDIQAGKAAGVAVTCGLSYGIGDPEILKASGPDHLLGSFGQLREIIL